MLRRLISLCRLFSQKKKYKKFPVSNQASKQQVGSIEVKPEDPQEPAGIRTPTKVYKWLYLPIIALSAMEAVSKGVLDVEILKDLYSDIMALNLCYQSYFYFTVFYEKRDMLDLSNHANARAFFKRLAWISPAVIGSALFYSFKDDMSLEMFATVGSMPFVINVATNNYTATAGERDIHPDADAKSMIDMIVMLISTCLTIYAVNQRMKEAEAAKVIDNKAK